MYCTGCGARADITDLFCTACGIKIPSPTNAPSTSKEELFSEATTVATVDTDPSGATHEKPRNEKVTFFWGSVVLAALVVLAFTMAQQQQSGGQHSPSWNLGFSSGSQAKQDRFISMFGTVEKMCLSKGLAIHPDNLTEFSAGCAAGFGQSGEISTQTNTQEANPDTEAEAIGETPSNPNATTQQSPKNSEATDSSSQTFIWKPVAAALKACIQNPDLKTCPSQKNQINSETIPVTYESQDPAPDNGKRLVQKLLDNGLCESVTYPSEPYLTDGGAGCKIQDVYLWVATSTRKVFELFFYPHTFAHAAVADNLLVYSDEPIPSEIVSLLQLETVR